MEPLKIFGNGLATGLILQLAIGPVFFFIINLSLQRSLIDGLVGVLDTVKFWVRETLFSSLEYVKI